MSSAATKVIVVGGGLAGLCSAHTILERGGRVLLLDKNSFLGGNSTKATSGINGALTKTQVRLGIKDSVDAFLADTMESATKGKKNVEATPLAKVLVGNSAEGVEWLGARFGLDLSLVSRLGGHSFPRTHRGKEKFPGMTITYALMEKLEDICKSDPHLAEIRVSCNVIRLLTNSEGAVTGCEYEDKEGKKIQEQGPVVLSTGGFGADFTDSGLLKKLRPELLPLPTTNGDHCTGDGIKMGEAIGANSVDLNQVQVHPTGLVHPDDPNAKVKFLAAEALRGVGGVLLDKEGNRFCDELGRRDYVTGEMWKRGKAPYRLILNAAAGKEIEWHCKHYQGRGLMKFFENGQALAKEMGISAAKLKDTLDKYNQIAKDKKDPFGKRFFHNAPFDFNDNFWVSIVTPVIHYCMGGLQISPDAEVMTKQGKVIPGLFAAGEVTGGVHGDNRLGGSSLQDCVVFGRVSGATAARYLFSNALSAIAEKRLGGILRQFMGGETSGIQTSISQPGLHANMWVDPKTSALRMEIVTGPADGSAAPASAPKTETKASKPATSTSTSTPAKSSAPAAPAKPAALKDYTLEEVAKHKTEKDCWVVVNGQVLDVTAALKDYTLEEVAKHKTEKDCWVVVNGQVLDVTSFLKDHPGGKQAILLYAGKDATAEFNMLHKPDVVQKYAPHTIIGNLKGGSKPAKH